jgi:ADP-ribose pyrophosphatase YjhB (NUDIX family)
MNVYFQCKNKCCTYRIVPYNKKATAFRGHASRKAGVLIFDKNARKILLVQSRGHLWGVPKGTRVGSESDLECALREVKEETGIVLDKAVLAEQRCTFIKNRACYFYHEMSEIDVTVQPQANNDANGIGWFTLGCLRDMVNCGILKLNQHSRILLSRFLDINMPPS